MIVSGSDNEVATRVNNCLFVRYLSNHRRVLWEVTKFCSLQTTKYIGLNGIGCRKALLKSISTIAIIFFLSYNGLTRDLIHPRP